eukprot:scaffold106016_cov27-Tisochrysis_lutea.AAC.1
MAAHSGGALTARPWPPGALRYFFAAWLPAAASGHADAPMGATRRGRGRRATPFPSGRSVHLVPGTAAAPALCQPTAICCAQPRYDSTSRPRPCRMCARSARWRPSHLSTQLSRPSARRSVSSCSPCCTDGIEKGSALEL